MLYAESLAKPTGLRAAINDAYRIDEKTLLSRLLAEASLTAKEVSAIVKRASVLVEQVRANRKSSGIDAFMMEYDLSGDEGVALMCLAEALLRVPDAHTIDKLIKDKITTADWKAHQGKSPSFFVNAATWGLMLTGKVLAPETAESTLTKTVMKLINRSGEGVVRGAINQAMRILSKQFVMGRTIESAVKRAKTKEAIGYRYSYDMLGEAALTDADAEKYWQAYKNAIITIGESGQGGLVVYEKPGISIKLSALHPRYQEAKRERVLSELSVKLLALAELAKQYDIGLTIDAEESERLDLSLDVIEAVFCAPSLSGWHGFGIAVQSYQKRAFFVLDWIAALAARQKKRIMVRLIKGAYWDSEIKKAQMQGFSEYPVFTRKVFTDVSFQACAKKLLTMTDVIYPQFATHNAYSVAMILEIVGQYRDFEFQCLHGMGDALYNEVVPASALGIPCRIYAPVGSHEDLLPYLVRRLLENGANSSFVNRIADDKVPIVDLVVDPLMKAERLFDRPNTKIPLPAHIFPAGRINSVGLDLSDRAVQACLQQQLEVAIKSPWHVAPMLAHAKKLHLKSPSVPREMYAPYNRQEKIGTVIETTSEELEWALMEAHAYFPTWASTSVEERASLLEKFADLLEAHMPLLLAMTAREAGKTLSDGVGEVREAVDFCRYYAQQAREQLATPCVLQGYTGERNELSLHPRGVALCISPWNFPLAIFVGQVVAALVTGNCVLAKPAEQTPLIAGLAVKLMWEAGIPEAAVQLLPGDGGSVGAPLVADHRVKAVLFTGSTQTANLINQTLATRGGEIIPLIAETGGQNAMIVDSTALLEQVVVDAVNSAFGSAGQRCSALRVIYVQEDVYPRFLQLLKGAMSELTIGDPSFLPTDIGPVIDNEALLVLKAHVTKMRELGKILYEVALPESAALGHFMPPTAIALDHIKTLTQEFFGPILHVIAYRRDKLDSVIEEINATGYGLTLGIHSRIKDTVAYIKARVHVGNCYVNRNMIGAVVGLQPFGGEGLSGTGPKAGGPHYLLRLCHERTYTEDTTAAGGNASLMSALEE
jgi:RHH-type proline utilization regulon transcriptional repressor/proline dehydrogenase/delta 1-pyrroline-5-carboxylate dehydrogenase